MLDIDKLTIGEVKQLQRILNGGFNTVVTSSENVENGLSSMIGKKVIIRTYSAGVWFGLLVEKSSNEVILHDARRMYRWWAKESISLSAVAIYGIKRDKSNIVEAVPSVWLQSIEIIPCSDIAIKDLEEAKNVTAS